MFTESNHSVDPREDCLDAAADALARCYRTAEERETTTAPAVAEAV